MRIGIADSPALVAAESSTPHSVSRLQVGEAFMDNGAKKFQACVAAFKAALTAATGPT